MLDGKERLGSRWARSPAYMGNEGILDILVDQNRKENSLKEFS